MPDLYVVAIHVLPSVLFGRFIAFGPKLEAVFYVAVRRHDKRR